MTTIATLFSGFGGVEVGALAAGLTPLWGIELDPAIAEVARANFAHRIHVANILECDPRTFDAPDVLHASPPCPSFSVAKAGGVETATDIALARKVARFVTVLQPRIFTLENVWAYRTSRSWAIIQDALHGAGYWVSVEHCNAADYGVPQTRKRMIVRAIRGGFVPYLPAPVPWVGWYAAIEDLLPMLPESQFAPWQLARLPEVLQTVMIGGANRSQSFLEFAKKNRPNIPGRRLEGEPSMTIAATSSSDMRAFLMQVQGEGGDGVRYASEPMQTVASNHGAAKYRAWLVEGANASRDMTIRTDDQPVMTIGAGGAKVPSMALSHTGRVVAMTPRVLARFQSFPDTYELPDNARLAAKGIGNAVAPLLYQRIINPLTEALP